MTHLMDQAIQILILSTTESKLILSLYTVYFIVYYLEESIQKISLRTEADRDRTDTCYTH